jgi:hypothetical protein
MRKSLFLLLGLVLSFTFCQSHAQAVENPPEDVSFIVGTTTGAPPAGSDTLILVGSSDWNVRLYRGRLKQPMINDGSGIYYTKATGSDTIFLHGDTWHAGELVQIEFYRPNGSLELGSSYVIQSSVYVKVNNSGFHYAPTADPGIFDNDGGGYPFYTTKSFTGNGYVQFKLVYEWGGGLFHFLEDESHNSWSIEYSPGFNYPNGGVKVYYNDSLLSVLPNSGVLIDRHLRLSRNGTTISLESSTTVNGVFSTFYTFPQSANASENMIGGGYCTGPDNGAIDCKIAGQSLVLVYD